MRKSKRAASDHNRALVTSWIRGLGRVDDSAVAYSYTSTWSSNQTMSNLVGPGRLLGKFYSWAGSSLEQGIGQFALHAGIGSYAKAVEKLQNVAAMYEMMRSENTRKNEKACEVLLICAKSVFLSFHRTLLLDDDPFRKDQVMSTSRLGPSRGSFGVSSGAR